MAEKPMTSWERLTLRAGLIYCVGGVVLGASLVHFILFYEVLMGAAKYMGQAEDMGQMTLAGLAFMGAGQAAGFGSLLLAICPFLFHLGGTYERTSRDA